MEDEENLIDYISQRFEVIIQPDGSYIVKDSQNTYKISKIDYLDDKSRLFPLPLGPEGNLKNNKILHPEIGSDDKEPNFDPSIKRHNPIHGMFPDFENRQKPLFQTDPTHPGKKNHKNWPEPDPDNFDPGKKLDEFDSNEQ